MTEQNQTPDYMHPEGKAASGENAYGETGTTGREGMSAMKEKAGQQAVALKERVSEKARGYSSQARQKADEARGKASTGLRNTSRRMQDLAQYLEEHDANEMSQAALRSSQEMVRKHPGKSLLVGMVVGMLIGRIFGMGGGRRSQFT
jgi:ElaB/YqjD/DUF883 family membrane-anchored ribosome-binding protein